MNHEISIPIYILLNYYYHIQLFLVLCTFQFYIGSHQQDDIDSNKVLTDFIWAKIISAGKSSSSSGSSSMKNMMPPNIPLVTIPYKPKPKARSTTSTLRSAPSSPYISSSSLKSSQRTKSLSRRSSYSLLNHLSSNSSPSYTFEGVGTKNVKYIPENQKTSISSRVLTANYPTFTEMSDVSASKTIDKKTTQSGVNNQQQQSKSDRFNSVTESVNGKEYQSNPTYQTETTEKTGGSSRHQELSKSIYDLVPMPTYGLSKYGSLKGGSLNDGTMNNQMNHQMKEDNNGGIDSNNMYQAKRTLEIVPMIDGKQSYGDQQQMEPQIIDVEPDTVPIQVVFRSRSTRVQVQQIHTPSKVEEVETSRTEEEPQRVKHQLFRPVIQEVLEIIQPYRMVTFFFCLSIFGFHCS